MKAVKERKKETSPEKSEDVVMMACCPEGEGTGEIGERVLMKIGEKLGGRSNVVMTRLSDEDLKQIAGQFEKELTSLLVS